MKPAVKTGEHRRHVMLLVLLILGSYFLGAVPFGLIVGKACRGIDIREYGSGNIGATNIMRTLGPGPAAAVFLLDVGKGCLPVVVARHLFAGSPWIIVACGMLAILGHTLSLFLNFRGGKGVATSLGVFIGLDWRVAVIGFASWVLMVAVTRYVSVAALTAAVVIPTLTFAFGLPTPYKAFAVLAGIFVMVKHRSNMSRLLQGKESRWGQKVSIPEATDGKE